MGGSSSRNQGANTDGQTAPTTNPHPYMPAHLGGQPQNQVVNTGNPSPPPEALPPSAGAAGAGSQFGVQEASILKMLVALDTTSVSYDSTNRTLKFSIISTAPSLTYEVHTGVRLCVKNGNAFYMPNKPKMEPPRILIEGPQRGKEISVAIDIAKLDETERSYNPEYPKQYPCVVVLRYRESNTGPRTDPSVGGAVFTEFAEHTAIDLAVEAKQRVITQIISTGDSAYTVESLFGMGEDNCVVGAQAEVAVGGSAAEQGGDDEDDGLCVICLTLPKNTAVIPCRHMCLCKKCAEELIRHTPKCPVCRGPVATLLHMPTVPIGNQG
uniref:Uncharacterized protein TCIL3000_10_11040 n=1 Tax=Trypanosoma congolense (strain IL3000) TaxID=1068625 RepID=G0UY58_TRYCI|nr:unnamed protein product [Trypanosoma congolense IL3000]